MRKLIAFVLLLPLVFAGELRAQPGEEEPAPAEPAEPDSETPEGAEEGGQEEDGDAGDDDQGPPPTWMGEPAEPVEGDGAGEWAERSPEDAEAVEGAAPVSATGDAVLRLYVITTRNTYARFPFDVYDVATGNRVQSGVSPDLAKGDEVVEMRLVPGTYKIVRSGDPFDTTTDFATVEVQPQSLTEYVIVIDPDSFGFRGAGVVAGELPEGTSIAGLRVALTAGAGAELGYRRRVVGTTPGLTSQLSVFGNFSLLYDRGDHHLQVTSDLNLTLTDPAFGKPYSSFDQFRADALYSFNINNPFIGPYVRAGFMTRVYPGYLYLDDEGEGDVVDVNITRQDGTIENRVFGNEANLDDLRIKLSEPFGPFILQEEVGANLKAFDVDLFILQAHVDSRVGYGFRQGLTNDILVVDGDDEGTPVSLTEVGNYYTHGPVVGADANVTFARWLYGAAKFGMMAPVDDYERAGNGFFERLLIDFSGTAGLKLPAFTSFLYASFDYTFRLTRDGYLTEDTQFDQLLMGRLNVKIF